VYRDPGHGSFIVYEARNHREMTVQYTELLAQCVRKVAAHLKRVSILGPSIFCSIVIKITNQCVQEEVEFIDAF
jgi:hypothetical protein